MMKIIVTGAAGFIGSNIIRGLNLQGIDNIIAVDDLSKGDKYRNLVAGKIIDYFDKDDFLHRLTAGQFGKIQAIFHQGACSDTMETNGRYMVENNFRYSRTLLDVSMAQKIQFLYASSAAVYGANRIFQETPEYEHPLNVYGYSKLLFDQVVRQTLPQAKNQIVGLRYFNVYGPYEQHKDRMASVAFHHYQQYCQTGKVRLFGDYGGYKAGEHTRDFIYIDDVVKVNLHFFAHPEASGIFNLGTGNAQPFNDIAHTMVNTLRVEQNQPPLALDELIQKGIIEYFPFPDALDGKYQCFTQADISALRNIGYQQKFLTVQEGVRLYGQWLARHQY